MKVIELAVYDVDRQDGKQHFLDILSIEASVRTGMHTTHVQAERQGRIGGEREIKWMENFYRQTLRCMSSRICMPPIPTCLSVPS